MQLRFFLTMLMLLSICLNARNEDGWTVLFNGENLDGWQVLNGHADYEVVEGAIIGIAKMNTPNTFLATEKLYSDFILEYEAWIDDALNAGVQIRSNSIPTYQNGRVHGYQVELDPSPRAWSGGIYDEGRRGWLYNLEANQPARKAFKNEQWNHFRIEAIGSHIRVWLNGIPTTDLVDEMTAEGFIGLQVHSIGDEALAGKQVRYRNIRIRTENLSTVQMPIKNDIPQVSYLNNQLTEREKADGWELLWDGKSANGWRGAKLDHFPEGGWTISDGVLTIEKSGGGESTNGGDIVTREKFGDFELAVDFRMTKGANSGIKYFVDTGLNKGAGSSIGCEFQILDDHHHPDAKEGTNGNRTLASLYDLIPANAKYYAPDETTSKRANGYGWNRAKIVSRDNKVAHYLNSIKVVEYERGTQVWRALVARSKYVVWPSFGELAEGHILLQDHGDEVSFRNIKIKTGE